MPREVRSLRRVYQLDMCISLWPIGTCVVGGQGTGAPISSAHRCSNFRHPQRGSIKKSTDNCARQVRVDFVTKNKDHAAGAPVWTGASNRQMITDHEVESRTQIQV